MSEKATGSKAQVLVVAGTINSQFVSRHSRAIMATAKSIGIQASKQGDLIASVLQQRKTQVIIRNILLALKNLQKLDPGIIVALYQKIRKKQLAHQLRRRKISSYCYDVVDTILTQSKDLRTHLEFADEFKADEDFEKCTAANLNRLIGGLYESLDQIASNRPGLLIGFQKAIESQGFAGEQMYRTPVRALLINYLYGRTSKHSVSA